MWTTRGELRPALEGGLHVGASAAGLPRAGHRVLNAREEGEWGCVGMRASGERRTKKGDAQGKSRQGWAVGRRRRLPSPGNRFHGDEKRGCEDEQVAVDIHLRGLVRLAVAKA